MTDERGMCKDCFTTHGNMLHIYKHEYSAGLRAGRLGF